MLLSKRKRGRTIIICSGLLSLGCLAPGLIVAAAAKPDGAMLQSQVQRYSAADRERRLAEAGLTAGNPVMIRIFKKESQLELWMQRHGRFALFETYSICKWSGKLGPKMREGDRQAPEGFYRVDARQLRLTGRNARSFYIDYPNALDRALGRTGSAIMVHGHCTSIGCFAMTDLRMEEIYTLVERALYEGQDHIEVHVFPFRMTDSNLAANSQSKSYPYWLNLKGGYDLFEETRNPPEVTVCAGKYVLEAGKLPGEVTTPAKMESLSNLKTCAEELHVGSTVTVPTASASIKPSRVVRKGTWRVAGRNVRKVYASARRARRAALSARHGNKERRWSVASRYVKRVRNRVTG